MNLRADAALLKRTHGFAFFVKLNITIAVQKKKRRPLFLAAFVVADHPMPIAPFAIYSPICAFATEHKTQEKNKTKKESLGALKWNKRNRARQQKYSPSVCVCVCGAVKSEENQS